MKAIIIILVILIAVWAFSYFGFIPFLKVLRGECTTTGGVTGGEITGYYHMGSCAT